MTSHKLPSIWLGLIHSFIGKDGDPFYKAAHDFLSGLIFLPVLNSVRDFRSLYFSGKLPTYPSPKPTPALATNLEQNVGLGREG